MNLRLMLGGIKSLVPGRRRFVGTGGTTDPTYCYSVWLRHWTLASEAGVSIRPKRLVELGPGDSAGTGLVALLSAAQQYVALDVLQHANVEHDAAMLNPLAKMLQEHAPIPDSRLFPLLLPSLSDYSFPTNLPLDTSPRRIEELRRSIVDAHRSEGPISYQAPWSMTSIEPGSADWVLSQVALQDMDHFTGPDVLGTTIEATFRWLRRGGIATHQIDLSCPGGGPWNHHWTASALEWKVIRGRRPYYVNRLPASAYLDLFQKVGFEVRLERRARAAGVPRGTIRLPLEVRDGDLESRALFVVLQKL